MGKLILVLFFIIFSWDDERGHVKWAFFWVQLQIVPLHLRQWKGGPEGGVVCLFEIAAPLKELVWYSGLVVACECVENAEIPIKSGHSG